MLSVAVIASAVGAMVVSVTGRPALGVSLFVLTGLLFAAQLILGHLE